MFFFFCFVFLSEPFCGGCIWGGCVPLPFFLSEIDEVFSWLQIDRLSMNGFHWNTLMFKKYSPKLQDLMCGRGTNVGIFTEDLSVRNRKHFFTNLKGFRHRWLLTSNYLKVTFYDNINRTRRGGGKLLTRVCVYVQPRAASLPNLDLYMLWRTEEFFYWIFPSSARTHTHIHTHTHTHTENTKLKQHTRKEATPSCTVRIRHMTKINSG